MRSLTAMHAVAGRHQEARRYALQGGTAVEFMQTYGTPNAEQPFYSFQDYALNGFAGNSIVFGLVDKRMSVFGEAAFRYRDLTDKHLFGLGSLGKLEVPWPNGSSGDLWTRMELDASLAGNAFIRDCGDQLERLRPDHVTIVSRVVPDARGEQVRRVLGYAYCPVDDPDRDDAWYPVDEVAHWAPVPDPVANWRGMSWLTPVVREINGDVRMSEYRDAYFRNAATPNIVIRYSQKMAPERINRLKTDDAGAAHRPRRRVRDPRARRGRRPDGGR